MLELKKLEHKYRFGAVSFSNVSFRAKKGRIFCVYGKEESGKTSLLQSISGILTPQSGEILFNGQIINDLPIQERNVCLLHIDGMFFKHKTVRENLQYPLKIRHVPTDEINQLVVKAEQQFNLIDFSQTKVNKIDKKTALNLAFARLSLRNADIYLIDDPFKGFDDQKELFDIFLPFLQQLSKQSVVIYTTSSPYEVLALQTDTLILNFGVVQQVAPISDIIKYPFTVFTYKSFHEKTIIQNAFIQTEKNEFFLDIDYKRKLLNKKKLLHNIYINKNVVVCSDNGKEYSIYDPKNEYLIYFDKID